MYMTKILETNNSKYYNKITKSISNIIVNQDFETPAMHLIDIP